MARLLSLLVILAAVHMTQEMESPIGQQCDDSNSCPGGSSCHPTRKECVTDPEILDRPSVFLGCDRKPSDCAYFGFDYDGSYYHGNGKWCHNETNVRCVSKVAPPVPKPSGPHELHVAAYNIWERPFWVTQDGQRERSCRIAREFAKSWPQLDVVAFQETFMGGCWSKQASLRDLMTQHGFPHHTRTITGDKVINGGIWIASRWPILEDDNYVFKSAVIDSWDFFSSKGVSYAKIVKTVEGESRTYHVMSTHFQAGRGYAGDNVRIGQATEWAAFVKSKNIPTTEAVIFAGDFNVHSVGEADILGNVTNILGAVVPPLLDDEPPATPSPKVIETQSQIDYTMYSNKHLKPVYAAQRFLNPEDKPFPVCWCSICPWVRGYVYPEQGAGCQDVHLMQRLSDHRPMYGKFVF